MRRLPHTLLGVVLVSALWITARRATAAPSCLDVQLTPRHVWLTHDGDTFKLFAFGVPPYEWIRVLGVDTPELRDSLTKPAREARTFTSAWVGQDTFHVRTCAKDSFGRYLAVVTRGSDTLAVDLIAQGLGVRR
jgi:endonuclease YncB( thermonuclease family)